MGHSTGFSERVESLVFLVDWNLDCCSVPRCHSRRYCNIFGQRWIFFWAHAVHARGSDGHQNVLSLISYSHMLENRWKQKARCLPVPNKANPTKNKNPTRNKTKTTQEDTQETRWDTTLSEEKSPSRSVLLHDVIANLAHKCPKWLKVSKLW